MNFVKIKFQAKKRGGLVKHFLISNVKVGTVGTTPVEFFRFSWTGTDTSREGLDKTSY